MIAPKETGIFRADVGPLGAQLQQQQQTTPAATTAKEQTTDARGTLFETLAVFHRNVAFCFLFAQEI